MVDHIRSDESLQVLVFVALPLLLLLAGGIFLRIRYTPPSTAKFPTFSVSLSRVGSEDAYIVYRDSENRLEFYVGPGERKQQLCLQLPRKLSDQRIRQVVPNLARGLAGLGFHKYKILKEGQLSAKSSQDGPRTV